MMLARAFLRVSLLALVVVLTAGDNLPDRKTMSKEAFAQTRNRHDAFHNVVYAACATRCADDGCAKTAEISDPTAFSPTLALFGVCRPECDGNTERGGERQSQTLPWFLRVSGWTCEDDCGYRCMHSLEVARLGSLNPKS